jgi:hypothetical protein
MQIEEIENRILFHRLASLDRIDPSSGIVKSYAAFPALKSAAGSS